MNYGKRKASKKQKRITSKKNMHKKKLGVRLFKGFLLCIFVCCILAAIGGGFIIKHVIDNAPEITADSIKPQGYTSTALADDGTTTIAEFTGAGANRVYKTIDQIPEDLQHAFVAIEDSRFYKHNGVDIQGIIRAFVVGITHGGNFSEGASTITQQLIKNNVFPDFVNENTFEEKLERKIQEQYLAIQVEKQLDKDSILESYLNTINLGQDCLGAVKEGLQASTVITKRLGYRYEIGTDYTGLGKIQYILGQRQISVQDTQYTDKVLMKVILPYDQEQCVVSEITEGTNGQAVIEKGDSCYFAEDGKEILVFEE